MLYHFAQGTCQSTVTFCCICNMIFWIAIDIIFLIPYVKISYVCHIVSFKLLFPVVYLYYSYHITPQASVIALILIVFE